MSTLFLSRSVSSQDDARQQYVDLISSLVAAEGPPAAEASPTGSEKTFQTLQVTTEDGITTIRLNRPQKKNAITVEVCRGIGPGLNNLSSCVALLCLGCASEVTLVEIVRTVIHDLLSEKKTKHNVIPQMYKHTGAYTGAS